MLGNNFFKDRNIYIPNETLLLHMLQKYSDLRVLEVFFKEPTEIHFIREISRKINLAPTSVKIIINNLLKQGFISIKKARPFNGYIANRENEEFLFFKRTYNLMTLYELNNLITQELHPKAIVLFGSYSSGEDIETSDIDILIISKVKKELNFPDIEKKLKREINIMILKDLKKLEPQIIKKIYNGIIVYGEI